MTNKNTEFDDKALLVLIANDDHYAFSKFFDKHFDEIYRHIYSKISDCDIAKDLVHDIFLKIWENRTQLQIINNVRGYLFTAARNKVLDYIAHNKIVDKYYESFLQTYNLSEETDYLIRQKEIQQIIEKEIEALPTKMKTIFLLSRQEYLTHREISEKLNISEKTVKTQINNSLKRLKQKLHPYAHFFLF